jgi:hypothetical protein
VFQQHTFVDRTRGLHSRTSVDDETDVANLKVVEELGATTLVPQLVAPPRTHTRTMITMTPGIPNLAEIAEVDCFGLIPETPKHDGVHRWCSLALTQPFGRPRERDKRERWRGRRTKERRGKHVANCCIFISPLGGLDIVGRRVHLRLHQGTTRAVTKGRSKAPLPLIQ